jgi:hypothetical protein
MAQIPVQKKQGMPWWVWLLLGIVILGLLWLLMALLGDDDNEAALAPEATQVPAREVDRRDLTEVIQAVMTPYSPPATPIGASETPAAEATAAVTQGAETPAGAGGPITDLTTIFEEEDKTSLVGRQVDLQGETAAEVRSVVGDTTFWVGPSQDQQVFVVLSEEQDAAGAEGRVEVNEGQTVRLTGQVQQLPSIEEARQQWGLSEANTAELQNQEIYISAEQVEIIER